jgi:hypothetical protein
LNKKNTNEQYVLRLSISYFILVMNIVPLEYGSFGQVMWMAEKLSMGQTFSISKINIHREFLQMS